jgi:hypothetical protein
VTWTTTLASCAVATGGAAGRTTLWRGFTTGLAATTTVVEAARGRLIGVRRA